MSIERVRPLAKNRGEAVAENDTWLTPPELIAALGKFGLDVCCPEKMPWETAKRMICLPEDGLAAKWRGRVWCNPPFSNIAPWAERMHAHGSGILLCPARSTDSKWGQAVLQSADAVLFQKGRPLFHFQDGTKSSGKWSPHMLCAYGEKCRHAAQSFKRRSLSWRRFSES